MIRNRVAVCGITLLLTLVVAGFFGWSINVAAGVVFLLAAVTVSVCFARRRQRWTALILLLLFCAGAGHSMMALKQYRTEVTLVHFNEGEATVSGYVCDLPEYDGRYRYRVRVERVNGTSVDNAVMTLVSDGSLHAELYDRIDGRLNLYPLDKSKGGVILYAYPAVDGEITISPNYKTDIRYYVCKAREKMLAGLDELFVGDTLGYVKGILLGEVTGMSEETSLQFRESGLTHVIVVSGMHLTVVSGVLLFGLRIITGLRRKWCALLAMLPIVLFMALVGFTPSVLRAGVAMLFYLISIVFDEDVNCLRSLGWAVIVVAIYDPLIVTDAGFLLSTFAVLGINLIGVRLADGAKDAFYKRFRRKMPKVLDLILQTGAATVGATLMTLPLCAMYFPRVSSIAIVGNLLIFFAVDIILILGIPMLLALLIGAEKIALILGLVVGLCAKYCIAVINWLTSIFNTTLPTYSALTVAAGLVCIAAMVYCVATKRVRAGFITCTAAVLILSVCNIAIGGASVRLTVTDSGCFVRDKEGVVSFVGFNDVYSSRSDMYQMTYAYDVDKFGLVVWNDLGDLNDLIKSNGAECVVTNKRELTASGLPDGRLIYGAADVTVNGVRYSCSKRSVQIEVDGTLIEVMLRDGEKPTSEKAAITVRRTNWNDRVAVTEITLRNNALATRQTRVYNSEREMYSVTIFDNGFYWIEKG